MLASMRFKDYVWPYNPRTFEIEYRRKLVQHRLPLSGAISQNMGPSARIFKGEGEFVGPNAYKLFEELADVFYIDTPGILSHPLWPSVNAYFTKLELKQEPQEDYVRYSFEFEEYADGKRQLGSNYTKAVIHIVSEGETLGSIAADNNTTLSNLILLNPDIKNPNMLTPGSEISLQSGVRT